MSAGYGYSSDAEEVHERAVLRSQGVKVPMRQADIHALYRRKAALETLVRTLERQGAGEAEIAAYAKQLQDVAALIPRNRPVVR